MFSLALGKGCSAEGLALGKAEPSAQLLFPVVGVFPRGGVTPTSKFVCVLPFPDGDARRHRERPAGGREFVLSCT